MYLASPDNEWIGIRTELEDMAFRVGCTEYGVLHIPLKPQGLDPDISYALPLTIVSNSEGYDVNEELKTMVYEVKMVNGFSGNYAGSSIELPKTIRSVQPTLKAMSSNSVRMPIHSFRIEHLPEWSPINPSMCNLLPVTIFCRCIEGSPMHFFY